MGFFPVRSPETKIFDFPQEIFPLSTAVVDQALREGVTPGLVAGFWKISHPQEIYLISKGDRRIHPTVQPLQRETVYDLASLTKILVTAPLFAALVESSELEWDDSVCRIFPEYPFYEITFAHLLSHTSGLPAWIPLYQELNNYFEPQKIHEISIEERQQTAREIIMQTTPLTKPGARCDYSDVGFMLLGFVLEKIYSKPLNRIAEEDLWPTLGLNGFYFEPTINSVTVGRNEDVAATEDCAWRGGVLQGQVHDDNCWAMGGFAGHAGVFGNAQSVLQFAQTFFEAGLSEEIKNQMWTRVSTPLDCSRTMGWDTPAKDRNKSSTGHFFSDQTVGHLGYTGTSLWMDLKKGIAVTLLTNRVHPTRKNDGIKWFRPAFHDALMEDLSNEASFI